MAFDYIFPSFCCCPECLQFSDDFFNRLLFCGVNSQTGALEPCTQNSPPDCTCLEGEGCNDGDRCPNPDVNWYMGPIWDQDTETGEWWILPLNYPYPNTSPYGVLGEVTGTGKIRCNVGWDRNGHSLNVTTIYEQPGTKIRLHVEGNVCEIYLAGPLAGATSYIEYGGERRYFTATGTSRGITFSVDGEFGVACATISGVSPAQAFRVFGVGAGDDKFEIENASGLNGSGDPIALNIAAVAYYGLHTWKTQTEDNPVCFGCVCACYVDEQRYKIPKTLHLRITGQCCDKTCVPAGFDCDTSTCEDTILLEVDLNYVEDPDIDVWQGTGSFCGTSWLFQLTCWSLLRVFLLPGATQYFDFVVDEAVCHPYNYRSQPYAIAYGTTPGLSSAFNGCCVRCGGALMCTTSGSITAEIFEP